MKLDMLKKITVDPDADYCEESVKIPLAIAILAVVLVAAPFIYTVLKINDEGAQAAVVTKYNALVEAVLSDLGAANTMLHDDSGMASIKAVGGNSVVKLIVPEVVLVDAESQNPEDELNVELEAIYWSPSNPIAGINGETYHVGDTIQGYEIVEIGKTTVHFKGKSGKVIVKNFYENLFK